MFTPMHFLLGLKIGELNKKLEDRRWYLEQLKNGNYIYY